HTRFSRDWSSDVCSSDLGAEHAPTLSGARERWVAVLGGAAIGFYDGIFGPGTGSFLMIMFVRLFGYDFLHAAASTKLVNLATNEIGRASCRERAWTLVAG